MSTSGIATENNPSADPAKHKGQPVSHQPIDTKAPLKLVEHVLFLDLLSVHLVRNDKQSTIISYHPDLEILTTARRTEKMSERIRFAGQSVYWQKMLQESHDPTLVLLIYLWHAMYSWDQALEHLYTHIRHLESKVSLEITQDLHVIRAHQLFYASLLDDFVEFIRKHENPAMTLTKGEENLSKHENSAMTPTDRKENLSERSLERECDNLELEITRLKRDLIMQEERLKNMMNLVFSNVNIKDSEQLKTMTLSAAKDSAVMKQVAYLTMAFLPVTFMAGMFGMNTKELNPGTKGTIPHYVACALPLTLVTIWIIIAFQSEYLLKGKPFSARLGWPYYLLRNWWDPKAEGNACNDLEHPSATKNREKRNDGEV